MLVFILGFREKLFNLGEPYNRTLKFYILLKFKYAILIILEAQTYPNKLLAIALKLSFDKVQANLAN